MLLRIERYVLYMLRPYPFTGAAFFMAYCIAQGEEYGTRFPNDTLRLSQALKAVIDEGDVPEFASRLRFVDSNTGLECVEVAGMRRIAVAGGIITHLLGEPYPRSKAKISKETTQRLLSEYEDHEEIQRFASRVHEQHLQVCEEQKDSDIFIVL